MHIGDVGHIGNDLYPKSFSINPDRKNGIFLFVNNLCISFLTAFTFTRARFTLDWASKSFSRTVGATAQCFVSPSRHRAWGGFQLILEALTLCKSCDRWIIGGRLNSCTTHKHTHATHILELLLLVGTC